MSVICFCSVVFEPVKNEGDGGGGHWLVRMEWRPARWLVYMPLLIFPCIIKSRSFLLALAHPGGAGKRAVKRLWCVKFAGVPQTTGPISAASGPKFTILWERVEEILLIT